MRLPQASDVISEVTGRDPASTAFMLRWARRHGLLRPSKHGLGATELSTRETAICLVGVMAAEFASHIVRIAETVPTLVTRRPSFSSGLPALDAAIMEPDFGGVLAHLIEAAPRLRVQMLDRLQVMYPEIDRSKLFDTHALELSFEIHSPIPFATIELVEIHANGAPKTWTASFTMEPAKFVAGHYAPELQAGERARRRTRYAIDHAGLFDVADAYHGMAAIDRTHPQTTSPLAAEIGV